MKLYAIVFFLLLACLSRLQAQPVSNTYSAKIDSLQTLISHQPKGDTTKVKRLNYLARVCFYNLQYQRGLLATVEARELAKKLHCAQGQGLYWRTLAIFSNGSLGYYYYNYLAKWAYTDRKQTEETVEPGAGVPGKQDTEKIKVELLAAITYFERQSEPEILANLFVLYANFLKLDEQLAYRDKAIRLFRENGQLVPVFFILALNLRNLELASRQDEANKAETEARTILANTKDSRQMAVMAYFLSQVYASLNRQGLAFEFAQKANQLLEKLGEKELQIPILHSMGYICFNLSMTKKAVEYLKREAALYEETNLDNGLRLKWAYHQVVFRLIDINAIEEAKLYLDKASKLPENRNDEYIKHLDAAQHEDAIGQLLMKEGNYQDALSHFFQALTQAYKIPQFAALVSYMHLYIAQCYQKLGQLQESIKYGKLSYDKASVSPTVDDRIITVKSSLLLAEVFDEAAQPLEAYNYLKAYQKLRKETEQKDATSNLLDQEIRSVIEKDELEKNHLKQEQLLQGQRILAIEKQREIDGLKAQAEKQQLQSKAEQAELDKKLDRERLEAKAIQNKRQQDYQISLLNLDIDTQRKIRTGLLGGLAFFALFVVALVRQNRVKQRFNTVLTKQKAEIERQRDQLGQTLTELKSTQVQLIQKEKLASLGELTAGIAHEIQNPLNFVNNFSDVSSELIDELKEGPFQKLPELEKEYAEEILGDLSSNLQKIHHHGGRASSIVKGMLEHSRSESGEKRPTNLNILADEYLKIAYHGLRAKDKNFNCELVTHFDPTLEPVEVAPQEIGRVLLNLYNNAFYAVSERNKQSKEADCKPTVEVRTHRQADQVIIQVKDNGTGIPESVKTKIFQPFFTTKPTGEGTGLGLSLSYDILTKGHGGTLTVESRTGEGTQFTILLPV